MENVSMASPDAKVQEWACVDCDTDGEIIAGVECHLTEDEYSPSGYGWYFALYRRENGRFIEYDGGIYWEYADARELAEEYYTLPIDYDAFMALVA